MRPINSDIDPTGPINDRPTGPTGPTRPPVTRPPRFELPIEVVQAEPMGSNFGTTALAVAQQGFTGAGMNIEARVEAAVDSINAGATEDLNRIVNLIESNRVAKSQVRSVQKMVEDYKLAVNSNNGPAAAEAKQKLVTALTAKPEQGGLGLPAEASEVKAANALPGNPLPEKVEDRDKLLSTTVESLSSQLESRAQDLSDLGAKLQIQLTQANNIFQRTMNLQATLLKSNNDTINSIIQKMA